MTGSTFGRAFYTEELPNIVETLIFLTPFFDIYQSLGIVHRVEALFF